MDPAANLQGGCAARGGLKELRFTQISPPQALFFFKNMHSCANFSLKYLIFKHILGNFYHSWGYLTHRHQVWGLQPPLTPPVDPSLFHGPFMQLFSGLFWKIIKFRGFQGSPPPCRVQQELKVCLKPANQLIILEPRL